MWLGHSPHPLVQPSWLVSQGAHEAFSAKLPGADKKTLALLAFLLESTQCNPSPLFNTMWYSGSLSKDGLSGWSALTHFLNEGAQEWISPHPLFDPDIVRSETRAYGYEHLPITEYIRGKHNEIQTHTYFHGSVYLNLYPDVKQANMPPLLHFASSGFVEGRSGLAVQDWEWLKLLYSRRSLAGINYFNAITGSSAISTTRAKYQLDERLRHSSDLRAAKLRSAQRPLEQGALPEVSVVIPTWNNLHLLLGALESLVEAASHATIEVLVVDNASTDQTATVIDQIPWATRLALPKNVGFAGAANYGMRHARGEIGLILNNDAMIGRDALSAAIETLRSCGRIGAVCPQIQLPDGALQEAGSYVLPDGSTRGFLRGFNPNEPAANFRRDVDYGSAAALLMRTDVFRELSGFDEDFGVAYGEDVDLMLRMWNAGYRVVYEPRFRVLHVEGGSSLGTSFAVDRMVATKQRVLFKHWGLLSGRALSGSGPDTAPYARCRRSIVVIDDDIPNNSAGAGFPRALQVIHNLLRTHAVVLLTTRRSSDVASWRERADKIGRELEVHPGMTTDRTIEWLKQNSTRIDFVWVSRLHNIEQLKRGVQARSGMALPIPVVGDTEALSARRDVALKAISGHHLTSTSLESALATELETLSWVDHVVVVSHAERELLPPRLKLRTSVVGHVFDSFSSLGNFEARKLVFLGRLIDDASPNVLGMTWFLSEVWPALRDNENISLHLAGPGSLSFRRHQSSSLVCHGEIEDPKVLFDHATALVAPTFVAAGIPHKVHEAASFGVPSVVTPLLAKQLGWTHDSETLVANSRDQFVEQILRLLNDSALWEKLSVASKEAVRLDCDRSKFDSSLDEIVLRFDKRGIPPVA